MNKHKILYSSLIIAVVLIFSVGMGWVLAYFTDVEDAENVFVFGDVEIVPNEPNWETDNPLVPNQEVLKDPQIANNGNNEAIVFIQLQVPIDEFDMVNEDGTRGNTVTDEIFWLKTNDVSSDEHKTVFRDESNGGNWVLLNKEEGRIPGSYNTYLFGYRKGLGTSEGRISNVLHPDEKEWKSMTVTEPLFDKVQLKNYVEGTLLGGYSIKLQFYAIQAEYLTDELGTDLTAVLFPNGEFDKTKTIDKETLLNIYNLYVNSI